MNVNTFFVYCAAAFRPRSFGRNSLIFDGKPAFMIKDHIDGKFMGMFHSIKI